MRGITFLSVAALLALVALPGPATASTMPLFFSKEYQYQLAGYKQVNTFTVPATNATWKYLCYDRTYFFIGGYPQAATIRASLVDAYGDVVVQDTGATVSDGYTFAIPISQPLSGGYVRGQMTLTFEGEGLHGDARIRVYGVLNAADCGHFK